jgi:RNAse (barnase) inhibitor barstar
VIKTKKIIIDGNNFSNEEEFYNEIDKLLTKDVTFKTGHNLDALYDILKGGFGVHEYNEELQITWINASKSKIDLGYKETTKHWEKVLEKTHPTNENEINKKLIDAKNETGKTLYEIIIDIIQDEELNIKLEIID